MASNDDAINLDYDERSDVLYVSRGSPQAALSYEITKDIWLDYLPLSRTVVGLTVINFLVHYPVEDRAQLLMVAKAVAQELLERYPSVPLDEGAQETDPTSLDNPYVQIFTTAACGVGPDRSTIYVSGVTPIQSPRVQLSQL